MSSKPSRALIKKTIDVEENRAKRAEGIIQLRKNQREESLKTRRKFDSNNTASISGFTNDILNKPDLTYEQRSAEMRDRLRILPELVKMINSDDVAKQVEATTQFRKLLSIERQPPIQEVIDCNVVPKLVTFLNFEHNPVLQFEAAWHDTTHTQNIQ